MASEPPVQVVDENDKPIGIMSKAEVHETNQVHRVVRIFLKNSKGEILLQKRSDSVSYPNRWDSSAAGYVDGGESYLEAVLREMEEEIGVKNINVTRVGNYYSEYFREDMPIRRFNTVFVGEINFTPDNFDPEEVSKVQWHDLNALKQLISQKPDDFVPDLVESIRKYF